MRLNYEQLVTLDQMGIPVWALRQETTIRPVPSESITDTDQTKDRLQHVDCLLVVKQLELSISEQQLLTGMLKAAGIDTKRTLLIEIHDALLQKSPQELPVILSLGESAISKALICANLQQLLSEPSLKAQAWQALLIAKRAIANRVD